MVILAGLYSSTAPVAQLLLDEDNKGFWDQALAGVSLSRELRRHREERRNRDLGGSEWYYCRTEPFKGRSSDHTCGYSTTVGLLNNSSDWWTDTYFLGRLAPLAGRSL